VCGVVCVCVGGCGVECVCVSLIRTKKETN